VGAGLFLLGAVLQYNDPDVVRWMGIYVGAAVACVLGALGRGGRVIAFTVGGVALLWALALVPAVIRGGMPREMVSTFQMMSPAVEEARECGGLLLIAGWMAVLGMNSPGRKTASRRALRDNRSGTV
jgi:hypothetical protein